MSENVEVDFGGWIQKGFDIWKDNLLTLIISYVIAYFVSGLSLGILAGPMMAGMLMIVFALHDKVQPKPQIGDLFKGFSLFLNTFLFFIIFFAVVFGSMILHFIPCIGTLIAMALQIGFSTLMFFALCFIVDKKLPTIEAMKASASIVKQNFFPFLGLTIVAGAIGMAGIIACGIGIFASMPIMFCIQVVAYRAVVGGGSVESTPAPSAPVPPPPPAGIDISRPS